MRWLRILFVCALSRSTYSASTLIHTLWVITLSPKKQVLNSDSITLFESLNHSLEFSLYISLAIDCWDWVIHSPHCSHSNHSSSQLSYRNRIFPNASSRLRLVDCQFFAPSRSLWVWFRGAKNPPSEEQKNSPNAEKKKASTQSKLKT